MRIAFLSIPRFPCAVEVARQPRLAREALIVGDSEQPKRVLDCSLSASKKGVRYGMTIRQAIVKCPEAVIIPPDPVFYRTLWEKILATLGKITPEIEDEEIGRAYLNSGGLHRHYGNEFELCDRILGDVKTVTGLDATIGLASGKFIAFAAGIMAPQGKSQVVAIGSEAAFLAPLTVDLLPCKKETRFRLHLLGLDVLGQVAALSLPELQSQFGFEGKQMWELTNGIDNKPLQPKRHSELVQTSVSLEAPVAGIDVMIALTRHLLSRLKPSLNGRAVREMKLQAELTSGRSWENHVVFKEPISEDERLMFLLRSSLNNFPPPQAISSLSLRLDNLAGESSKQMSLDGKSRRLQHLEQTIHQLRARYGYSPVYRCVDVNPWSVIPEERQILVESDT